MSRAEIELTLPADDAFRRVAHLVLGGLATRHDLTVETLEDLMLALDAVLSRYGEAQEEVTVRLSVGDEDLSLEIGPFHGHGVTRELEQKSDDALDLHRILYAVCDDVSVSAHEETEWVELRKRLERAKSEVG